MLTARFHPPRVPVRAVWSDLTSRTAALDSQCIDFRSPLCSPLTVVLSGYVSSSGREVHLPPLDLHGPSRKKNPAVNLEPEPYLLFFLCQSGPKRIGFSFPIKRCSKLMRISFSKHSIIL